MSQYPFFHDAPPSAFERARQLRKNMTLAEKELWTHIRKEQLDGFRFRRQHPVDNYILDFYCHESRLAIELDGEVHNYKEQKMYDAERDRIIEELGIKTLRFKNEEIFSSLKNVLQIISREASSRLHVTKSSPEGEDLGGVKPILNPSDPTS